MHLTEPHSALWIILLAVRWHCRYPLSYRDVRDLLAERGNHVVPSTLSQARRNCGLNFQASIVTDKAPTYPAIVKSMDVKAPIQTTSHQPGF